MLYCVNVVCSVKNICKIPVLINLFINNGLETILCSLAILQSHENKLQSILSTEMQLMSLAVNRKIWLVNQNVKNSCCSFVSLQAL